MNLTIAELADLPLAAATFEGDGHLIAQTPEWSGAGPGAVSYPVRGKRLVVSGAGAARGCEAVVERLLAGMAAAAVAASGTRAARIAMLAASLRLIAGRTISSRGTNADVLALARAGIAVRTGLDVEVEDAPCWTVDAPEVVALVLVQLAANAERHARVTSLTICQSEAAFHVVWRARSPDPAMSTARRREWRDRWGMGFARIAADTVGGAVYPPATRGDGTVAATFELGLRRLALPLAVVVDGRVVRATRAWDEETGHPPGDPIGPGSRISAGLLAAAASPGRITVTDGVWARRVDGRVWLAIPPDDIIDRARDVLDGIRHERALWDDIPEPEQSRSFALASLLGAMLGETLPRVPAHAWNRRFGGLCEAFGVSGPIPHLEGIGAIDPRIVAYLTAEFGRELSCGGEELRLRLRRDSLDDPLVRVLRPEGETIRLT